MAESKHIKNIPCPDCSTHDKSTRLAVYENKDGTITGYCFGECDDNKKYKQLSQDHSINYEVNVNNRVSMNDVKSLPVKAISDRGLSREACSNFGIKVSYHPTTGEVEKHYYPNIHNGQVVGYKIRECDTKRFYKIGDTTTYGLFGQDKIKGGTTVIITEGECFLPDAEVLTEEGWTAFKDYKNGKVLQINSNQGGEWVYPDFKVEKDFNGDLVQYKSGSWESITTPDHNLVRINKNNGNLIKQKARDDSNKHFNIPRVLYSLEDNNRCDLSDMEIRAMVMFSADWSYSLTQGGPRASFKKDRKRERAEWILSNLNLEYSKNTRNDGYVDYRVFKTNDISRIWAKEFDHSLIYKFNSSQISTFLWEAVNWDGNYVQGKKQLEYSSKLYNNAKFVQTLAHLNGWVSTIIPRSNQYGSWYKVSILLNKTSSAAQRGYKTIPYNGKVYCLTVPSGMLLVRQKGSISISGNCDAAAAWMMMTKQNGDRYNVVSLPDGANVRAIKDQYEWLDKFKTIILAFDQDRPGKKAAREIAELFNPGQVKIANFSEKDPNDMLQNKKLKEFKQSIFNAKEFHPDGIFKTKDLRGLLDKNKHIKSHPFPWNGWNDKLYGFREREIVTLTAGCVDADTEFLSNDGWKKISNYKENYDMVLQYHKDGSTSFVYPQRYIKKPTNYLWHIKTKYGVDQVLSDEHRVIYKTENSNVLREKILREIREIHDSQTTGFRGKILTTFEAPLNNGTGLTEEQLRVQVMFQADGCIQKNIGRVNLKKGRKIKRAHKLLTEANIKYKVQQRGDYSDFYFKPPFLKKTYSKYWYRICTKRELEVICEECLQWDGDQKSVFFSTIEEDAKFIQYAFSAIGKRATLLTIPRHEKGHTEYNVYTTEVTNVSFRKTSTSSPTFKKYKTIDGFKYCFTVPSGMLVLRRGKNIFITGNSGLGKSAVTRELSHWIHKTTDDNIGVLALEESPDKTMWGMMSIEANKPLMILEKRYKAEQKDPINWNKLVDKWWENTHGTGRIAIYDHFGSTSEDNLLNRVRYLIKALDCKWIILDHLSIVVSAQDSGDERKTIDSIMTKLRTLTEETGAGLFLVSHLRRTEGDKGHERGKEVTLSHLRGSQSIAQLSDAVIGLERDQQAPTDKLANLTTVRVLKNRYAGLTGIACYLAYEKDTGRLTEIPLNKYEEYLVEDEDF